MGRARPGPQLATATITAAAGLTATSASYHLRKPRATRNAELDIKWSDGLRAAWSGGLGTTAVVAVAVQRSPLQLIYRVSQKSDPLNILQQQPQICSDLNKILRTQDDICYKHYYVVSHKSALTLLKYEFLNNITHKSIFCSRRFTAARDQFHLGNSAVNLLAPNAFSTLSIFIKTRSSFDNMLFVYQHALTSHLSPQMTSARSKLYR